jgi:HlyD family secretion protein
MSREPAAASLLHLARQIWQLLDDAQKRECVFVLLISIAAACLTLVGVAGIAPFFAVLADPASIDRSRALVWLQEAFGLETAHAVLVWLGIGFVAVLSLANLASLFAIFSIGRFAQGVGARMHSLLFAEYLHRDIGFHSESNSAVLSTRVIHDVNRTVAGVIHNGLALCASAAAIVLITGAVVVVDPLFALAAAVALSCCYTIIYAMVRRRLTRNGTITTEHWKSRAHIVAAGFAAIRDVILRRAQPTMVSQLDRHSAAIAHAQASTAAIAASPRYALECLMGTALVAAALWVYGTAGADRWLTHLAFLGFAAYRLLPAAQQAFASLARIHAERPAFEGIVEDLRAARRREGSRPCVTPTAAWRGRPREAIRVVDVSYRYSAQRGGGVNGVSLEIPAGSLAGFVGPNGAGKTTLAEIILGLLVPDSGRVEIDGIALDAGHREAWHDTIAYVPQQIALVCGTIAENVAFGASPNDIDRERVLEAIRGAQLEDLVAGLPDGVATMIGENGACLSGGQRQRVGLARAFYRRASLLVVDEGTNALDLLTEAEIMTLLGALRGKCTMILIGHRPSALAGCDVLFELDGGRLVGRKTVAELAAAPQTQQRARR